MTTRELYSSIGVSCYEHQACWRKGGIFHIQMEGGNSTFVALTFSRFEARTRSTGLSGCEPPNSSHAVFACGVSGRYWLWSVAELHGKVAASRRGSWSGSESPSTEDVCLRC